MQLNAITGEIDLTPIVVPPRSRLHHLQPIGLGTSMVESLTGFTSRLAMTHHVTLAALFGYEISPLLNKEHLRRSESRSNKNAVLAISFRSMTRAVNGTGATAKSFVEALKKLTLREGLFYLTMLPWKDVLSHRHLIKSKSAWCPACYEGWRSQGAVVYEPLLWSLEVISSCLRHKRRLRTCCRLCQQSLHSLASHSRPGYCSVCGCWLGESETTLLSQDEVLGESEFEWQRWAVEQVGELLSAAPTLAYYPQKSVVADSIRQCIEISRFRNELEFARNLRIPQPTLNDWRTGNHVPQLDRILRVCLFARVSLLDFILGRLPKRIASQSSLNKPAEHRVKHGCRLPRRWTEAEINKAKAILEAALEEKPPSPMVEISRRLDRSASTLQARFTELCRGIIIRYANYCKERQFRFWERVRLSLEAAIKTESPPCVQQVARILQCSKTVLVQHFPKLCEKLSNLYKDHRRAFWRKVKLALENSLEEIPPRTVRMIAKELGRSHTSLLNYYPHLCRQVAARYAHYRREQSQQRDKRFRQKIRETALAIYDEGKYPSVRQVSQRIDQPRYLRSSKIALEVLRELRRELGLSDQARGYISK